MRSAFLSPRAINALATRLVLTLKSANVVCRPSNSKAGALPRAFACARTISARLAGISVADMSLLLACLSRAALALVDPPIDGHHRTRFKSDVLADGGHVPELSDRDLGHDLRVQHLGRRCKPRAILRRRGPGIVVAQLFHFRIARPARPPLAAIG